MYLSGSFDSGQTKTFRSSWSNAIGAAANLRMSVAGGNGKLLYRRQSIAAIFDEPAAIRRG